MVRRRPLALTIVALGLVYGLYSEGYDRLFEAHFLKDFTIPLFAPAVWLGIMWIGVQLTNFVLLEVLIRRVKLSSSRSIVIASMIVDGVLLLSLIVFALAGNFYVALAACWIGRTLRLTGLYEIWVNQNLDSRVRATVLSFSSQIDALGQFLGGPLVGLIGTTISIPVALLTSALLLSPSLLLYANALRLNRQTVEPEVEIMTSKN